MADWGAWLLGPMQIGWIGIPIFCGHFVADSGMFLFRFLPLKKIIGS
jgi:hypothetical protein